MQCSMVSGVVVAWLIKVRFCLHVALGRGTLGVLKECCVTVVKFNYEYLFWIKANVDVRQSIMRVA